MTDERTLRRWAFERRQRRIIWGRAARRYGRLFADGFAWGAGLGVALALIVWLR